MKVMQRGALITAIFPVATALCVLVAAMFPPLLFAFDLPSPNPQTSPLIATALPSLRPFTLKLSWIGIVQPQTHVPLTAMIPGRIEAIEIPDETQVEKGVPVMRLGGPKVEEQRTELSVEIGSLKARLALAEKLVEQEKMNIKIRLVTTDKLTTAEVNKVKIAALLSKAEAKRRAFRHHVVIEAPITGIFTKRRVATGQNVAAGQGVGDLVDTAHLRIAASLFAPPGLDLKGKTVHVLGDDGSEMTATITHIFPVADRAGALKVWIQGQQIHANLRPGQDVHGSVTVVTSAQSLGVPLSAVVYDEQERPLLFVAENGSYTLRRIRTGIIQHGWVQVLSGLERDRKVVVHGAYELYNQGFARKFKVQD